MHGERRLELALRSFPRRFRATRAAEIRTVFADACAAGDEDVYGARSMLELVVAGWSERLRARPPLWRYVAYKLGARLPTPWHGWMLDDVRGRFVGMRNPIVWTIPTVNVVMSLLLTGAAPPTSTVVSMFAVVGVVGLLMTTQLRKQILHAHGYDHRTLEPLAHPPASVVPALSPRRPPRRWPAARTLLAWGGALLAVAPVAALAFVAPTSSSARAMWGELTLTRSVDAQREIGIVLCCVALVTGGVAMVLFRRIETFLVDDAAPPAAMQSPLAIWVPVCVYVSVSLVVALTPVAPLVLPALCILGGGLGPIAIVLGVRAVRRERSTGHHVVLRRVIGARAGTGAATR
jgi:hypothetical protein